MQSSPRKRFHKPCHLPNKVSKHFFKGLEAMFQNFQPEDFRKELNLWLHAALASEQSAYGEGGEREDLMDFVHHLHRLIEAFCILHTRTPAQQSLPAPTKGLLTHANRPFYLTEAEQGNPAKVIRQFRRTFRYSYAKAELLDLLEAVITYKGEQAICRVDLVMFYRHLLHLVRLAYRMHKRILRV
ncbi:MAG: hypothetical protein KF746_12675 [Chitinophagaceae bacterium]|nr:hypothetical protein [Chitinophagaceae bacterium]